MFGMLWISARYFVRGEEGVRFSWPGIDCKQDKGCQKESACPRADSMNPFIWILVDFRGHKGASTHNNTHNQRLVA